MLKKILAAALCLGLACALVGCRLLPGPEKPGQANRSAVYTVDTKPEGPMLYPVLSKSTPFSPWGGEPYYTASSFKLVNERWEDVTGYINGSCEYIRVDGEIRAVQVREYVFGETYEGEDGQRFTWGTYGAPYVLGLDGKPIQALEGLVCANAWRQNDSRVGGLLVVSEAKAYGQADDTGDREPPKVGPPKVGAFNLRTGKLQIPIAYADLWVLGSAAIGLRDDKAYKLDLNGKELAVVGGGDWYLQNGDGDWLLVNSNTYIDRNGDVVLRLEGGMSGDSDFYGDYACAIVSASAWQEDGTYSEPVCGFIDRRGNLVGQTYVSIYRSGDYYVVSDGEGQFLLDSSLREVLRSGEDEYFSLYGDYVFVTRWEEGSEQTQRVVSLAGEELLTFPAGSYSWEDHGLFISRTEQEGTGGFFSLYAPGGRLLLEGARRLQVTEDGKFIYADTGKYMGFLDRGGAWVYRINATYFNLED